VNNEIDPATGQLRLKATLPNDNGALWPGQFVTVQLLLRVEHNVPTVPSTAIQRGPDGYWLYVVGPDNTASVQAVKVRRFGGHMAVLEGGPAPGTTVVSSGQYRVTPGAHIKVAQAQPTNVQGTQQPAAAVHECIPAVHRPAGRDHPADGCLVVSWSRRLPASASRPSAAG
jgi:hypothetical protein